MTRLRAVVLPLLVALGLASGCTSVPQEQDDKELVVFDGPGFSIKLPGEPVADLRTVTTPAGDIDVAAYVVESDDSEVAVATTRLPAGVPGDLDGGVRGTANGIGGRVVSSEVIEYDGYAGRDCRITVARDGEDATLFCRLLLVGPRLVQVQQLVDGEDLQDPPESYLEILESLELAPPDER